MGIFSQALSSQGEFTETPRLSESVEPGTYEFASPKLSSYIDEEKMKVHTFVEGEVDGTKYSHYFLGFDIEKGNLATQIENFGKYSIDKMNTGENVKDTLDTLFEDLYTSQDIEPFVESMNVVLENTTTNVTVTHASNGNTYVKFAIM